MATITTTDEYTLCDLTPNSVNVLIKTFIDLNGVKTQVGDNKRISFANSEIGREKVSEVLPQEYALAVLAVWGDAPTIQDPPKPEE